MKHIYGRQLQPLAAQCSSTPPRSSHRPSEKSHVTKSPVAKKNDRSFQRSNNAVTPPTVTSKPKTLHQFSKNNLRVRESAVLRRAIHDAVQLHRTIVTQLQRLQQGILLQLLGLWPASRAHWMGPRQGPACTPPAPPHCPTAPQERCQAHT